MWYFVFTAWTYICGAEQNSFCHFWIFLWITTHLSIFSLFLKNKKKRKPNRTNSLHLGPYTFPYSQCALMYCQQLLIWVRRFCIGNLEKLLFSFSLPRALSRAGDGADSGDDSVRVVAGNDDGGPCGKRGARPHLQVGPSLSWAGRGHRATRAAGSAEQSTHAGCRLRTPASIRPGTATAATAGRPASCDGPARSRGRPSRRAAACWPRAQARLQRRSTAAGDGWDRRGGAGARAGCRGRLPGWSRDGGWELRGTRGKRISQSRSR
jgi:hypothetical protein